MTCVNWDVRQLAGAPLRQPQNVPAAKAPVRGPGRLILFGLQPQEPGEPKLVYLLSLPEVWKSPFGFVFSSL
jgi:hypothetical protein